MWFETLNHNQSHILFYNLQIILYFFECHCPCLILIILSMNQRYTFLFLFYISFLQCFYQSEIIPIDSLSQFQSNESYTLTYQQLQVATCSPHMNVQDSLPCQALHISIHKYSDDILFKLLLKVDSNHLVRQLYIHITNSSDSNPSFHDIGSIFDKFLTFRMWWILSKEHFYEHHRHHINSNLLSQYFLLRHEPIYENYLRYRAALQFPPENVCKSTRLRVAHCDSTTGFGTLAIIYSDNFGSNDLSIFDIYDSIDNTPEDRYPYTSPNECPNIVNKRQCAYLPVTNCSLPHELVNDYTGEAFTQYFGFDWFILFTNASVIGHRYPEKDESIFQLPPSEYQLNMKKQFFGSINVQDPPNFPNGPFYMYKTLRSHDDNLYVPNARDILLGLSLIFRTNTHFRYLIHQKMMDTKKRFSIHPYKRMKCTAIHIRRNDRVIQGVKNMTTYCKDILHASINNEDRCFSQAGEELSCHNLLDYGMCNK